MLPKVIQNFLWSNDLKKINLQKDKTRIILSILNIGSQAASNWLFDFYPQAVIRKTIINYGAKGELSAKSLNYWTLILDINQSQLLRTRL